MGADRGLKGKARPTRIFRRRSARSRAPADVEAGAEANAELLEHLRDELAFGLQGGKPKTDADGGVDAACRAWFDKIVRERCVQLAQRLWVPAPKKPKANKAPAPGPRKAGKKKALQTSLTLNLAPEDVDDSADPNPSPDQVDAPAVAAPDGYAEWAAVQASHHRRCLLALVVALIVRPDAGLGANTFLPILVNWIRSDVMLAPDVRPAGGCRQARRRRRRRHGPLFARLGQPVGEEHQLGRGQSDGRRACLPLS